MNKKYIFIYLLGITLVIIGAFYFFKVNNSDEEKINNYEQQESQTLKVSDLKESNYIIITGTKSENEILAERIIVCDAKDNCLLNQQDEKQSDRNKGMPNMTQRENIPKQEKPSDSMVKFMTSGIIATISEKELTINLESGETATVILSELTQITKRPSI